jgi:voltage-gated potassium channel
MQTPPEALGRRDRRRLVARAVLRVVLTTGLLLALYALASVPFVAAAAAAVRLVAVLVLLAVVIAVQVASIRSASYPALRAAEALVVAIVVFLVSFALLYLGLAGTAPASFNQPLDRVGAFYFAATVLATVGFGDITAQTAGARLLVTVQMLVGLGLLAVVVRVFSAAARAGAARREVGRGTGPRRGRRRLRPPGR